MGGNTDKGASMDMSLDFADVRASGARGDGTGDDSPVFEKLLQSGASQLYVPQGEYALARPIRLRSRMRLIAHPLARLRIADGAEWGVGDALLTNADWQAGDCGIEVSGGIWDGNCKRVRRAAEDERSGYTGNLILFRNVRQLALTDLHLVDPASYFVAMAKVRNFRVERIRFEIRHHTRNQDGIHVSGHCEDGFICDIAGYGRYCPGDDLVALNADDALDRSETRACLAGAIRRMTVIGLKAEDCHAFMRMASVWSPIEDVLVRDLEGGCVDAAINADCLRFCRSPLFDSNDPAYVHGCGDLRNIHLSGLRIWKTRNLGSGMLQLHARMQNCVVENFERVLERDANPDYPSIDMRFVPGARGTLEGLNAEDAQRINRGSCDVGLNWLATGFSGMATAGFVLGPTGRLTGNINRFRRMEVFTTPMRPLPEPDCNKGMSR